MATQKQISSAVKDANSAAGTSSLGRLRDLHDFKVADGYPDIRGWDVEILDRSKVGKVDDLIVDTNEMRARYLNVKLDRSVVRDAKDDGMDPDGRHTLLPIGVVALDERADHVVVNGVTLAQIALLPVYDGQAITVEYETSVRRAFDSRGGVVEAVAVAETAGGAVVAAESVRTYEHPHYDDQRLYATRRNQAAKQEAGSQRLTLAEEQLSVGKRQVSGGEVDVRKTVDTRHVQEQVAVTRDEVTVERRPITDASQLDAQPIGEGEIRVPVMEEQLVVEKKMVPVEQIIVRKTQVVDQQTVQADLRKERLVTEGLEEQTGMAASRVAVAATMNSASRDRNAGGKSKDRR